MHDNIEDWYNSLELDMKVILDKRLGTTDNITKKIENADKILKDWGTGKDWAKLDGKTQAKIKKYIEKYRPAKVSKTALKKEWNIGDPISTDPKVAGKQRKAIKKGSKKGLTKRQKDMADFHKKHDKGQSPAEHEKDLAVVRDRHKKGKDGMPLHSYDDFKAASRRLTKYKSRKLEFTTVGHNKDGSPINLIFSMPKSWSGHLPERRIKERKKLHTKVRSEIQKKWAGRDTASKLGRLASDLGKLNMKYKFSDGSVTTISKRYIKDLYAQYPVFNDIPPQKKKAIFMAFMHYKGYNTTDDSVMTKAQRSSQGYTSDVPLDDMLDNIIDNYEKDKNIDPVTGRKQTPKGSLGDPTFESRVESLYEALGLEADSMAVMSKKVLVRPEGKIVTPIRSTEDNKTVCNGFRCRSWDEEPFQHKDPEDQYGKAVGLRTEAGDSKQEKLKRIGQYLGTKFGGVNPALLANQVVGQIPATASRETINSDTAGFVWNYVADDREKLDVLHDVGISDDRLRKLRWRKIPRPMRDKIMSIESFEQLVMKHKKLPSYSAPMQAIASLVKKKFGKKKTGERSDGKTPETRSNAAKKAWLTRQRNKKENPDEPSQAQKNRDRAKDQVGFWTATDIDGTTPILVISNSGTGNYTEYVLDDPQEIGGKKQLPEGMSPEDMWGDNNYKRLKSVEDTLQNSDMQIWSKDNGQFYDKKGNGFTAPFIVLQNVKTGEYREYVDKYRGLTGKTRKMSKTSLPEDFLKQHPELDDEEFYTDDMFTENPNTYKKMHTLDFPEDYKELPKDSAGNRWYEDGYDKDDLEENLREYKLNMTDDAKSERAKKAAQTRAANRGGKKEDDKVKIDPNENASVEDWKSKNQPDYDGWKNFDPKSYIEGGIENLKRLNNYLKRDEKELEENLAKEKSGDWYSYKDKLDADELRESIKEDKKLIKEQEAINDGDIAGAKYHHSTHFGGVPSGFVNDFVGNLSAHSVFGRTFEKSLGDTSITDKIPHFWRSLVENPDKFDKYDLEEMLDYNNDQGLIQSLRHKKNMWIKYWERYDKHKRQSMMGNEQQKKYARSKMKEMAEVVESWKKGVQETINTINVVKDLWKKRDEEQKEKWRKERENPKENLQTIETPLTPEQASARTKKAWLSRIHGKIDLMTKEKLSYTEAMKGYTKFTQSTKLGNYSFNPKTGNGFDAFDKKGAIKFWKENSNGKDPVYVVGITNHQGDLDRETESAYNQIVGEGNSPLIGHWKSDDTGFDYTDISFSFNHGKDDNDAKNLAKKYEQESVLKITKDGTASFVEQEPHEAEIRQFPNTFADHFSNESFNIDQVILGLKTAFLNYDSMPEDIQDYVKEEMKRRTLNNIGEFLKKNLVEVPLTAQQRSDRTKKAWLKRNKSVTDLEELRDLAKQVGDDGEYNWAINERINSIQDENTFDVHDKNSIHGAISNEDDLEEFDKAKDKFLALVKTDGEIKKKYEEVKKRAAKMNAKLKERHEKADIFFRGTTYQELDTYKRSGKLSDKISRAGHTHNPHYNFKSLTMDVDELSESAYGMKGLLIEFDGDSVRKLGSKPVMYNPEPTPFLSERASAEFNEKNKLEMIDQPNALRFAYEQEVRIPKGDVPKINKVHIAIESVGTGAFLNDIGGNEIYEEWKNDDFPSSYTTPDYWDKHKEKIKKLFMAKYPFSNDVEIHTGGGKWSKLWSRQDRRVRK